MKSYRHWLIVIVLVLVGGAFSNSVQPTAAQCSVRADWPTYRVQAGDTLSRIARRYNTQVSTLTQANCLGSTRIYSGQTLYVPPGSAAPTVQRPASPTPITGGRLPTAPGGTYQVGISYREFQNGLMIWNGASGAIWAFDNTSKRVTEYPLAAYGGRSSPRDFTTPQPGCFRLYAGFAQVWYNFPEVRTLGCATTRGELADQMLIDMLPFGRSFTLTFTQSNRTPIRVGLDGSWQYQTTAEPTPLPPLNDSPRIGTTYQAFDNGFMIWLATTNDIYVYIGSESGVLEIYPHSQYAALQVRINQTAPSNHFQPQNGFGRVWSNFVRDRIGWPVSGESGYLMTPMYDDAGTLTQFNLPEGNYAWRRGTTWQVSGHFIPTPAPTSTLATPTASPITPYPSPTPLHTISTWAAYQPFENGFMFWRQDTDEVYVFSLSPTTGQWVTVFNKSVYQAFPNPTDVPPGGGLLTPTNAFGKVWTDTRVHTNLGWATAAEQGYNATISDFLITGVKTISYSHITLPGGRQIYANIAYSAWSWLN